MDASPAPAPAPIDDHVPAGRHAAFVDYMYQAIECGAFSIANIRTTDDGSLLTAFGTLHPPVVEGGPPVFRPLAVVIPENRNPDALFGQPLPEDNLAPEPADTGLRLILPPDHIST